jgi:SAM-dependent methyltransferase
MKDLSGKSTLEVMQSAVWYNKWLYEKVKDYANGEILEIGVGIGNFTKLLLQRGSVTAIDTNRNYLDKLAKDTDIMADYGFGDIEKGKYFFKNKKFDCIVSFNVFEHIKNDQKALENSFNLLKKKGVMVCIVPAHEWLFSKFDRMLGHFRRYSKGQMRQKSENAGFEVIECSYLNWWGAVGWWFWLKLTGFSKMPQGPITIFDLLARLFLWPERYIKAPFGLSVFTIAKKL